MPSSAASQPSRLPGLVAALWWGSLSTVGFLVVPLLFAHLPTPLIHATHLSENNFRRESMIWTFQARSFWLPAAAAG